MQAVASKNIRFVAHSDLGGKSDGVQVMVHRGYAYIGHGFSNGISTLDVRDPKHPKVVDFIECPPGTRAFHLQAHDDLLLTVNAPSVWNMQEFADGTAYFDVSPADKLKGQMSRFTPGMRVYDISKPAKPVEIGFMPVNGLGPQRIWYTGGRYAYVSIHFAGFQRPHLRRRRFDRSAPARDRRQVLAPRHVARRRRNADLAAGRRYAMHHCVVAGNLAYAAWRDGGMTVIDISEPDQSQDCWSIATTSRPSAQARIRRCPFRAAICWCSAMSRPTTTARKACATSGCTTCAIRPIRSSSRNFPQPAEADYCAKGGAFGPHNLHEIRPGSFQSSRLIFATYYNAGVRVYDIENPYQPNEVGYWVPPDPTHMIDPRPNRPQVTNPCDCYVDPTD